MKMIRVFITKDDRKKGLRHNLNHCPVARAIQRATGKRCMVNGAEVVCINTIGLPFWKELLIGVYDLTGIMLMRSIQIPDSWLPQEPAVGTVLKTGEMQLPKENGKYISITA